MSLQNVLLGMLATPASGYDLKHRFEMRERHYWSANLAQVYPTLNRMERDGLLESHSEPSDKGPPRKVYRRTDAGDRALRSWLTEGPEVHSDRLSWLAQVGYLDQLDAEGQRRFLTQLREEFIRHRLELEQIEREHIAHQPGFPDQLPAPELFGHFTLRLGLSKYRAIVAWCDECLARLDRRNGKNAVSA